MGREGIDMIPCVKLALRSFLSEFYAIQTVWTLAGQQKHFTCENIGGDSPFYVGIMAF